MKALYIIHVSSFIYGAGRSLKLWLNNVNHDFDIIIPMKIERKREKIDLDLIRSNFSSHLKNIYICWLPFSFCYVGASANFKARIANCLENTLAFIFRYRILKLIKKGNYKYVHLNSLVLYSLIQSNQNIYIHIREILDKDIWYYKWVRKKIGNAKGVVYIDDATHAPLEHCNKNSIVINNPFDMEYLSSIDEQEVRKKYNIPKDKKVFSILGQIAENKGVKFVIETFKEYADNDSVLLVAGACNKAVKYHKQCLEEAVEDKRIHFVGEVSDPGPIYKLTDCVIRGDVQFAIGRTIYEGLYSGCQAIVPIDNETDMQHFYELDNFSQNIFGYPTRNKEALGKLLNQIHQVDKSKRQFYSNVDTYVIEMEEFLNK